MQNNVPTEVVYTLLASAGGVARYLSEYLKHNKFSWTILIANVFISSFSGYMFAKFSTVLGIQSDVSYIFAGLGGFLGTRALEFMSDYVTSKMSKK